MSGLAAPPQRKALSGISAPVVRVVDVNASLVVPAAVAITDYGQRNARLLSTATIAHWSIPYRIKRRRIVERTFVRCPHEAGGMATWVADSTVELNCAAFIDSRWIVSIDVGSWMDSRRARR